MKAKNVIFYFSDQQRWDTVNETLTPNLMELAKDGTLFEQCYTCQPVCGPARACLQTGLFASQNGCHWNGIPLENSPDLLADQFGAAGYETAYIGKWHLASGTRSDGTVHCETTAIPAQRRGGYSYWRASDVLEFTSHGYDGYLFDGDGNKLEFTGYRADCINDYALEFLQKRDNSQPFFLFVSQIEPHHQNDHNHYEGYKPTVEQYRDYPIPEDLCFLPGDYREEYPDYLSAINRLDYNIGRLVETLKELGLYEDTVIVYTSDHGSHFRTRNMEYKRSCHDSCTHIPLLIAGGAFAGGGKDSRLVSLIDLPPTLLSCAGIPVPQSYMGNDLNRSMQPGEPGRDCVFMQISESHIGRAIRTADYKYSVRSRRNIKPRPGVASYYEDFLYDLRNDPYEKKNLARSKAYQTVREELRSLLIREMKQAGETEPVIKPAPWVPEWFL